MFGVLLAGLALAFNGERLQLESCRLSAVPFNRVWTGVQRPVDQTRPGAFVSFDLDRPGELEITGVEAQSATLFPLGERGRLTRRNGAWRLRLDRPGQYVLDFGEARPPLHVFADPPFDYVHSAGEIYFGPGDHDAGVIAPTNGQTVCIDRGAVVHGALFLDCVTNVSVVGRGILDCSRFSRADERLQDFRRQRGLPPIDTEFACHSCVVRACENVRISGFVLRDTPFWALIVRSGSRHVEIDGLKIVGQWRYNSDGIDISASSDVAVRNTFVRSFDDCLVVLGAYLDTTSFVCENVSFENCRLWCDWGASFKLWSQPYTNTFRKIAFRDSVLMQTTGKPLQVKDTCGSPATLIEDVSFENLELDYLGLPPKMQIQKTDGARYPGREDECAVTLATVTCPWPKTDCGNQRFVPVKDPSGYRSTVRRIRFADFTFPGLTPPLRAVLETSVDGQTISDVAFVNLPALALATNGTVRHLVQTGTVPSSVRECKPTKERH